MSAGSSIEWTDATWNPTRGCSRVSEGCRNCYAEKVAARFSAYQTRDECGVVPGQPFAGFAQMTAAGPRWTGKVELIPKKLDEPLHWRKPQRVFVNSMSDLFHEALPDEALDRVFAVMALAQQHTFQILTKRPERMRAYMADRQTPFRVAKAIDAHSVDVAILKTPYELRPAVGADGYFVDNTGQVFTVHGSGHCVWCKALFDNGQQDSVFCGQKCRSASHYAKTQGRDPEPAGRIMRRVTEDVGEEGHTRVRFIGGEREFVHRLVLRTFARLPEDGEQGCHKDGNPLRNHICNLRWGSQSDNWADRLRHGNAHSYGERRTVPPPIEWPLPNCWFGVSVEDQATADERIPLLLQTPAAKRFVSYEPALGPVDFRKHIGFASYAGNVPGQCVNIDGETWHAVDAKCRTCGWGYPNDPDYPRRVPGLDWVICGGESGPGARPFDVAWARSTVEQCRASGTAVFVKQLGSYGQGMARNRCEHSAKGGHIDCFPEDLRVREFPR